MKPEGPSPTASHVFYLGVIGDDGAYISIGRGIVDGYDRIWAYNWDGNADKVGAGYTIGEWCHVALVHSSGQLHLYKNGSLVGSASSGNTGNVYADKLVLGQIYPASVYRHFQGLIDDVRIFNRAIDATEVTGLYSGEDITTGMTARMAMEEGTGTTTEITDGTGLPIDNATLTGGPTWSTDVPALLAP